MAVKSKPLYEAFDTCRAILQSEGKLLSIRELRKLIESRFPDVIEQHQALIYQAGINSILRSVCKRHSGESTVTPQQIAMQFGIADELPAHVAIPTRADSLKIGEWKELGDCTMGELRKAIRYLNRCADNDRKKADRLNSVHARITSILGRRFSADITIAEAVRLVQEAA